MNSFPDLIKNRTYELLTIAGIVIFLFLKLPDINTPFSWDEMGVYVPAAFQMVDSGHISLLPGSIDPLFSRGHPLLFTFCNALVFKVFGETVTAGHVFALILAIATLVLFFITSKKLFDRKTAFFATVLLAAQPIFFSLSLQLLPEMMLTFLTIGSVYGYLQKKWVFYAIFSSLAMLTKESAAVIPATVILLLFIQSIREKDFFSWKRFRLFIWGAVPLFVFALFICIQKIQNGWFFFPEHMGYIHWANLTKGGGHLFNDLFTAQGRWPAGISFLIGLVLCFLSNRLDIGLKREILLTFSLFIFLAFLFADINYYLTRYLFYAIPFIISGGTYTSLLLFEKLFSDRTVQWMVMVTFFTCGVVLAGNFRSVSHEACDMSYKMEVHVCKDAIQWAEKNWSHDTIEVNFPIYQGVMDPRNGYLTGKPLPYSINFRKPVTFGLLFFMEDKKNLEVPKCTHYEIVKTFDEDWAHVAAVEFKKK